MAFEILDYSIRRDPQNHDSPTEGGFEDGKQVQALPIYSTQYTDTGVRLGAQLLRGDLQRTLIAAVRAGDGNWRVTDAQYAYDQGDPAQVPSFDRAVESVEVSLKSLRRGE